jgi:hypothetical protein
MKPDISEFSYAFALTSELIDKYSLALTGAPVFPSLYSEGQTGGGYDAQIPRRGIPVFLQFKLSHCMVTRRAGEADLLDVPYFRMLLRPLKHSRQHQLLLELEQEGNEVYYAAPEFSSPHDLNSAYLRREVSDRTAFFTPSAIGPLPDDGEHHVVFLPESTYGYLCSRPKQVERQPAPIIFGTRIPNRARSPDARSVNSEFFLSVVRQLLSIYRRIHPSGDEEFSILYRLRSEREPEQYARYISQTLFDCELLLAYAD